MSLDRFRLQVQLWASPDGVAYRAVAEDGTTVEVRDLSGAKGDPARWRRVAHRLRLAASLVHPATIRVRELDLEGEPPLVVVEWVDGPPLAEALRGTLPLPEAEAIALAHPLAGALAEAHRLGPVHGRIDPRCIILDAERRPRIDLTGIETGTISMPETIPRVGESPREPTAVGPVTQGVDRDHDIRDLGALIAWMLTGRWLRASSDLAEAGIDPASPIGGLLSDMLATDPADRPSAQDVAGRLDALPDLEDGERARRESGIATATAAGTITAPVIPQWGDVPPACGLRLGRFRLLEEIGRGGQGVVYRAEDAADGSIVAIKVLRPEWASRASVLRRFRKEARLLAEVNNPFVVNLLEHNEDGGVAYLVLELVTGRSLGALLAGGKPVDESTALEVAAAVAHGLSEAHERGIVHRDVKPGNILLVDPTPASALAPPEGETAPPTPLRVKLSDFGLARHLVETESLALTEPGAVLGTPQYMAPEQCTGRSVDPRTDVYALGATLFHMLAGRPPFVAASRDRLYDLHCHEPPPPLERYNPSASPAVGQVVARALAKAPEDRYRDAGAMLRDLERIRHGEPVDIAIHPRLPACDPTKMLHFEFRWELRSSPRQLWPYVTNTDRLDRAIGFAPVTPTVRFEPGHGVRTFTEGRKCLLVEVGEEHPYEWVEPRRMGVLREYTRGPFRWLVSEVELLPGTDRGTILVHRLRLEPRYWLIRRGSPWGIGHRLRDDLGKVYRRIDAVLTSRLGRSGSIDPFEGPAALNRAQRRRLEERLDRLTKCNGVDPAVVERLGDLLGSAPAPEVARIRPLALAHRWGLEPAAVVTACLQGAREGLLAPLWDILCPSCRLSCDVKDTLRAIREHANCPACHLDFQLDFARSIELIFRAHPEIRAADTATYCVGGPGHSPHVLAQVRVAPGERIALDLALPEGAYRLRGPQLPWSLEFQVQSSASAHGWDLDLARGLAPEFPRALRPGSQSFALTNGWESELLVRVERNTPRDDVLTAARASTHALFRELFPDEVLSPGQLVSVATVTLLITELDQDQVEALYTELADAQAFGVIQEHFRLLEDAIRRAGGAIVKTLGEGLVAAFEDPADAVRLGIGLPAMMARGKKTRGLRLRAAIHRGAATSVTLNDRLDYFGATVHRAMRLVGRARGGDLVLSRDVAADPQVTAVLAGRGLEAEVLADDPTAGPGNLLCRVPVPSSTTPVGQPAR
jgi:serine/threonine protein kinase/class 3 adenylate cyclase